MAKESSLQARNLTGYHSPVTGSGRSLPPLGAIHIILDPVLYAKKIHVRWKKKEKKR